jgi:hypothetical protein
VVHQDVLGQVTMDHRSGRRDAGAVKCGLGDWHASVRDNCKKVKSPAALNKAQPEAPAA